MGSDRFGRQPQPVTVQITGEPDDVTYWLHVLTRQAGFKGDDVQLTSAADATFKIFPRAVND